jgi:hypothetical protein
MNPELEHYLQDFVQRIPRYAVKPIGGRAWRTKNKPLADPAIKAHLEGQYYVATCGKWYPPFAVLDLDEFTKDRVEALREQLELDTSSSFLFTSERPGCYHLYFKPIYNGKPPTLRLLNDVFVPLCANHNIEIYPQPRKVFRLPLGHGQRPVDEEYAALEGWPEILHWMEKLDDFDISGVPYQQLPLSFPEPRSRLTSSFQEGYELLQHGLQCPHSRYDSQFKVLYYFWRINVELWVAIETTWDWIRVNHNGLSRDIIRCPHTVRREIERQAAWIYSHFEHAETYPDEAHNRFYGYITKPDIIDIVEITAASLPKMNFLYNLVKFAYPRRYRRFINVHRDLLVEWSSEHTYLSYLGDLEEKGIVRRFRSYQVGKFAKSLQLDWSFRRDKEILYDGRSLDHLDDTIRLAFTPDEFRQVLERVGVDRRQRYNILRRFWNQLP